MVDNIAEKYRHSGELSDLTVKVGGEDFHLHRFLQTAPGADKQVPAVAQINLDGFPGGAKVFSTVADFCYNKEVNLLQYMAI